MRRFTIRCEALGRACGSLVTGPWPVGSRVYERDHHRMLISESG